MKKFTLTLFALVALIAFSFAQEKSASWPEMKAFHTMIAATFHPAEEGDLKPLREKADSLFNAAHAWQNSVVPDNFKKAETDEALRQLVTRCGDIQKLVLISASDDKLKAAITDVHEIFHKIAGECRKADN